MTCTREARIPEPNHATEIGKIIFYPQSNFLRQQTRHEDVSLLFSPQELVRAHRAQKRELRRSGRHGELCAAGGSTVSAGAARLRAASDVSSQTRRKVNSIVYSVLLNMR